MNEQELLDKSREALGKGRQIPAAERLQRLIDKGIIDERGQVKLWDADLAVIAVTPNHDGAIQQFRCVKPDFGNPGASTIDVSRESLKRAIEQEGRRVVTAVLDPKQNRWKEGPEVHVTAPGAMPTALRGHVVRRASATTAWPPKAVAMPPVVIVGRSPVGRATVGTLRMNIEDRVRMREKLLFNGEM